MDQLLTVMEIVALACLSALSVYAIVVLSRVNVFLGNMERDVHDLTSRALPVFSNLEAITTRVRNITDGLQDEAEMVRRSIRALRGILDSIVDFERRIQRKIEEPVMESVSTFTGIYKAVKAFLKVIGL